MEECSFNNQEKRCLHFKCRSHKVHVVLPTKVIDTFQKSILKMCSKKGSANNINLVECSNFCTIVRVLSTDQHGECPFVNSKLLKSPLKLKAYLRQYLHMPHNHRHTDEFPGLVMVSPQTHEQTVPSALSPCFAKTKRSITISSNTHTDTIYQFPMASHERTVGVPVEI